MPVAYTVEQRRTVVKLRNKYENAKNTEIMRLYNNDPVSQTHPMMYPYDVTRIMEKFETTGSLNNKEPPGRPKSATDDTNTVVALASFSCSGRKMSVSNSGTASNIAKIQQELTLKKSELAQITEDLSKLNARKRKVEKEVKSLKEELEFLNASDSSHADLDRDNFPWSHEALEKLKDVFKIQSFRSHQRAAVNATMSKIDCILIMPTGGGKSLCFQLPAILSCGITLVISPLLALMEDQLQGLKELKIPAALLNSQTHKDESKRIFQAMIDPASNLKLLYVTPERLAKSKRFMSQLEKMYKMGRLARLVIDEVHCCSSWGHDFRPDYKFLGIMKRQFAGVPIIGLTATATTKVTLDIQKMLNMEGCLIFKDSFFRANLKYEVYDAASTKDRVEELAEMINARFRGQSGIIYCLTIADVENVTSKLQSLKINCDRYHAQLESQDRTWIQRQWYTNQISVIVATVAFGLGINKLDVRYVIHYSISKSLENFYQESGRGGRDGAEAFCILFYQLPDVFRATSMMMAEKNGIQNVYNILEYCLDRRTCRKAMIAQHFGDSWDTDGCQGMCDNCRSRAKLQDLDVAPLLRDILKLLSHGEATEQRVTITKLMNGWFSKGEKKLRLDTVAVPRFSKTTCETVVARLLLDQYLGEEFHFTPYATISHLVPGPRRHPEGTQLKYSFPSLPTTFAAGTHHTDPKRLSLSPKPKGSRTFVKSAKPRVTNKDKPFDHYQKVIDTWNIEEDEDESQIFMDTPLGIEKTKKPKTFSFKNKPSTLTSTSSGGTVTKKRKMVVESDSEEDHVVTLD